MKTKAAVLFETNEPLRTIEMVIPSLKAGQVLVDIAYSGLCHSQLNEIEGLKGKDNYLPHTLGHEGSGVVLEIGEGVKKVKPGDHVVLTWIKGIGLDVPSTTYQLKGQNINSGAISTFMEKAVISENRLIPISKEMPLKEAALLGCAIPTGAGIVINNASIQPGDSVAIFGVGGIGLSAVIVASALGAGQIIAVDVVDYKLELAAKSGATHTINASTQDALAVIMDITGGKGVKYSIESAGSIVSMETAFKSVMNNGGKCIIAGNLPHGKQFSIDPMDLILGKNICGSWGGETNPDLDIPKYVEWHLEHKLNLSALLTHEYSLGDINRAFSELKAGKVGRALVCLNHKIKD
ncbi:MAG: zinc-binding dehydrogenase [Candidatus Marinimicrobia bacterium]|nr:zinc-binding dehydrogenase [Candidatus Neomarinimicrobiota bacterium]